MCVQPGIFSGNAFLWMDQQYDFPFFCYVCLLVDKRRGSEWKKAGWVNLSGSNDIFVVCGLTFSSIDVLSEVLVSVCDLKASTVLFCDWMCITSEGCCLEEGIFCVCFSFILSGEGGLHFVVLLYQRSFCIQLILLILFSAKEGLAISMSLFQNTVSLMPSSCIARENPHDLIHHVI